APAGSGFKEVFLESLTVGAVSHRPLFADGKDAPTARIYRPRLTAFFSSAPATNFVTFLAGIFNGTPVWGFLPVRAFRELTEKVPNPTNVTLPPFFNDTVTPSMAEFKAALA